MSEVTLIIKIIDGQPTVEGLISVSRATEILECSPNTVRNAANNGKIRYFWINHGEKSAIALFYKVDVLALKKDKNNQLKSKGNSK